MRIRLISLGITLLAALALAPGAWAATTFAVNSTGDGVDANTADGVCAAAGGFCTLRAAIDQSNATSAGTPHTIDLKLIGGQTLAPATALPAITRDRTFIDGCGVGREIVQDVNLTGLPKPPASDPCVGLNDPGALTTGLKVTSADGVFIQGLAITGFDRGIHLWGADHAGIGGNWLGLNVTATTVAGNGVGISVTGRSSPADPATENIVGGASSAADAIGPACDAYCNLIAGSTVAGIDLGGGGGVETPAGGACGQFTCGNFIRGNWIGVASPDGSVVMPNAVAITLGDSEDTEIGGSVVAHGNVIAGNDKGVDQGAGTGKPWLLGGIYGLSPDTDTTVPNGQWNARLHGGSAFGLGPFIQGVTFGPTAVGLEINGSYANLLGSRFSSPDGARFTSAAVKLGPGGDLAFIGSSTGASPPLCFPSLTATCNTIGDTAPGVPGIWINGADDASIVRTSIGFGLVPPIDGPPIRFDGGASGAIVGDDEDPDLQNRLVRSSGPAVEVSGAATGIVIAGNSGLAIAGFDSPGSLFTDLLPAPGPGNTGPANGGIQAPTITQSTVQGVGGTGIPGATVRVLVQERTVIPSPETGSPGETFPATPAVTTVEPNGIWGVQFSTPIKAGQKALASQTTAAGSSEYASPQAATADSPPVLVTFTSGPAGVVATRSATFTFVANRTVKGFECSVDAGAFVPCSSPFTLNGLDIGGHQIQVRGVDPTGVAGNRASRTWIVQFDEPLTPQPAAAAPASSAGVVRFSSLVTLPSARRCISRRSLRITVRAPKGGKVKSAEVRIGGRRVGSSRRAKTIPVSLKGLPAGRFVVRVKVALADGRVISGSRTYRTCAKKRTRR